MHHFWQGGMRNHFWQFSPVISRPQEITAKVVPTKQGEEMTISRDRVTFQLGGKQLYMGRGEAITDGIEFQAAQRAFGLTTEQCQSINNTQTTIVCRPSQFARFLIYRNDLGGLNLFKDLNPKLVPAPTQPALIDVSMKE